MTRRRRLALSLTATALSLVASVWLLLGRLDDPVTPNPAALVHGGIEYTGNAPGVPSLVAPVAEESFSTVREALHSSETESSAGPTEQSPDPRLPIPDSVLQAKYPNLSDPDQAEGLARGITDEIGDSIKRLAKERDRAGIYEVFPLRFSADGELLPFIIDADGFRYQMAISHRDEGLWHLVTLPEDEFPELYRLHEEVEWLMHRSIELRSAGVPADGRRQSD